MKPLIRKIAVSTSVLLVFSTIPNAADHTILSRNCTGKTSNWYDRTTGDNVSCGCPCGTAKYMGIKGQYYTPLQGEIWYKFTATEGNYKVAFFYQGDSDGKAPYKIYVAGAQIGSGTVGSSSGSTSFGPVCIKNGDEIRVWARSDYSTGYDNGKHGNYCRWSRLEFTRSGSCGQSTGIPGPVLERTMTGVSVRDAQPNMQLVFYSLRGTILRRLSPGSNVSPSLKDLPTGCTLVALRGPTGSVAALKVAGQMIK